MGLLMPRRIRVCNRELLFEQLEERIVLDGDCGGDAGGDSADADAIAEDASGDLIEKSDLSDDSTSDKWTDLGNGWFSEDSGNYTLYSDGTTIRFAYDNTSGCWLVNDDFVGWTVASDGGMSADFIGDGTWHWMGNNLSFCYNNGFAYWGVDNILRFAYEFDSGFWLQTDSYVGWTVLSEQGGLSGDFIGDGTWHDVGGVQTYLYDGTYGHWGLDGNHRFAYDYTSGYWLQNAPIGGWSCMGFGAVSADFIGDGNWHWLGGNQVFMFSNGNAHWGVDNVMRFAYSYDTGQWMDYRPEWGWNLMGDNGLSAEFIGDGAWHQFDTYDQFRYDGSYGWWQVNGADAYRLDYAAGQWQYYASDTWSWNNELVPYYTDSSATLSSANADWGRYFGDSMFLMSTTQGGNIYYDIYDQANGNYEVLWACFDPGLDGVVSPSEWRLVFERHEWPNEWENTLEDTLVICNYNYQDWSGGPGSGIGDFVDAIGLIGEAHGCLFDIVGLSEHAAPNYLSIGDHLVITSSNIGNYTADFVEWGSYMDSGAEIQFYGCQLAGSPTGRALVNTIAGYSGVEVWASDDYTGPCSTAADLYAGGPDPYESVDWRLEYSSVSGHGTYQGGTALTIYDLVYTPTSILNGWI